MTNRLLKACSGGVLSAVLGLLLAGLSVTFVHSQTGYWVVVGSYPQEDTARMKTDRLRMTAEARRCGVSVDNDFSIKFEGFREGYNVFVIGPHRTQREAQRVMAKAQTCFPNAYVRHGRYIGE